MEKKYILTKFQDILTGFMLEANKLYDIDCFEETSLIENMYIARVSNIVPNIGAAFVDIAKGESCYLAFEDYCYKKKLKIGDEILVQVTRDKIKSKQMAVTTKLSLAGRYVVVSVNTVIGISGKITDTKRRKELKQIFEAAINSFTEENAISNIVFGGIIRTEALAADDELVMKETVNLLCKLWGIISKAKYQSLYSNVYKKEPEYVKRLLELSKNDEVAIITDIKEIFDIYNSSVSNTPLVNNITLYNDEMLDLTALYSLNKHMTRALSKTVYLKSGAYIVIEPTEALTVIDVNTGKAIKGQDKAKAIYNINQEAAHEIVRQLRIRNISGIIIIDFISMNDYESDQRLMELIQAEATKDTVKVNVVDMTRLGLMELTRQKSKKSLKEIFG